MSENSDAVVIVVSEETGQISVAMNGVLTRDYTHEKLRKLLEEEYLTNRPMSRIQAESGFLPAMKGGRINEIFPTQI